MNLQQNWDLIAENADNIDRGLTVDVMEGECLWGSFTKERNEKFLVTGKNGRPFICDHPGLMKTLAAIQDPSCAIRKTEEEPKLLPKQQPEQQNTGAKMQLTESDVVGRHTHHFDDRYFDDFLELLKTNDVVIEKEGGVRFVVTDVDETNDVTLVCSQIDATGNDNREFRIDYFSIFAPGSYKVCSMMPKGEGGGWLKKALFYSVFFVAISTQIQLFLTNIFLTIMFIPAMA